MGLPKPECKSGYTARQITEITGANESSFWEYMRGQTMTICDGQQYSHELQKYIPTNCGPHGSVVYPWDLERFLKGLPPLD
jgi:hypothetical protein